MRLYNTLTRRKETFVPLDKKNVSMYVCGITPYDTTHLGHAFTYVHFDVLLRYLQFKKYNPIYTQNVTDINDRDNDILLRAKDLGVDWRELAEYWTKRFLEDMKALNWVMPTNYLKASEHIPTMITLIQSIINRGFGYEKSGSVYLDITKVKDFGKLSKLSESSMLKLAREFEEDIDNPDKKHKLDITLWKASAANQPTHIPSFESPFGPPATLGKQSLLGGRGRGRPGWHIECSAMAISSLSEQIDIHGGGKDLIYPHHESEIAQSEAATGKTPFARFWLHTGTVYYKGKKMSKSLGNLVLVSDLLRRYSSNAIRYLLLSHHYREDWEFNEEELEKAEGELRNVKELPISNREIISQFEELMDDDLDTPAVLNMKDSRLLPLLGFRV